ncbi:hypothetical protein CH373_13670 [Leptospira perolatii]|uniref:Haemin-degrading HemS/ChuX domain-containing protein n=1 Tax=Leptospira perolatii TaxID=2023191 RepID=A0A2M9ZKE5_9LEPT|nr:ChuX/HutX family heme-like substrate-binding protein [Leptospira perolatii]PJZ69326.1 hypothetical protein CH360_11235 [Leptospira perolatii]PJZ72461.1 hypothetical protein CH373_13670 [Leptospira perolatii]
MIANTKDKDLLIDEWKKLRELDPSLRIRDCAERLNVSEAELLYSCSHDRIPGFPFSVRLIPNWTDLLKGFQHLGKIMSLTRNDSCVHERQGYFENVKIDGPTALVIGPDIDLRIFLRSWKYLFAVEEEKNGSTLYSFQIFDEFGTAIQKVYLKDESKLDDWKRLRDHLLPSEKIPFEISKQISETKKEAPINPSDRNDFLEAWSKLEDSHEFFPLLRKFNISRIQSMKIGEGRFTVPSAPESVLGILKKAAERQVPIMAFVGNPGCIQIHTGTVQNIKVIGSWWNVMDPDFNLHLRSDKISEVWKVIKPSKDGPIHSVEVYDSTGEMIVQFFGKRKPGVPERMDWKELLSGE